MLQVVPSFMVIYVLYWSLNVESILAERAAALSSDHLSCVIILLSCYLYLVCLLLSPSQKMC